MIGSAGMNLMAGGASKARGQVISATAMLASVTSCDEARACIAAGVDIIDCKDPATGALGALPLQVVAGICVHVGERVPVSATIGDVACQSSLVLPAARAMAETGCDIVKVGLLPGGAPEKVIADLGEMFAARRGGSRRAGVVAVMFADLQPVATQLIRLMGQAGFSGVMLDTANKTAGRLGDCLDASGLETFVATAHEAGLFAGLAGSLRVDDVGGLLEIKPDVLGFRGGLCVNGHRGFGLDEGALRAVRRAIGPRACAVPDINLVARTGM